MAIFLLKDFYFNFLLLWLLSSVTLLGSALPPRMTFSHEETLVQSVSLPSVFHLLVRILLERDPDKLTAVGKRHLLSVNFRNPSKTAERKLTWADCGDVGASQSDCDFDVVVALEREDAGHVLLCGADRRETICCDTNLSEDAPSCRPADDLESIRGSIRSFVVKGGEHSALVESAKGSSSLYVTYSGSQEYVGIHKFGKNRVGPANHDKEQHYLGLLLSRWRDDPSQDQVYAFYRERNKDTSLSSSAWTPYVTRVCVADMGGPKNNLQFTWTSQLSARLYCGDQDSRQSFFELVDVATVHADRWQDTRVYALFRNEWNMSGVCVYALQDIRRVFTSSAFKGADRQTRRPRGCVSDSTALPLDVLKMIQMTSEMEQWVWPVNKSGPLLLSHHVYTHIHADVADSEESPVLFLSLASGGVHKVVQTQSRAFIIAEYRPFNHRAHIGSIVLHPSSKKLYLSSTSQLLQVDAADCARYGETCEECVLARDPYCSWDGASCNPDTSGALAIQDVTSGNYTICTTSPHLHLSKVIGPSRAGEVVVPLPPESKYFLQCPTSSRHALYAWRHRDEQTPCDWSQHGCLLLIDSMGTRREGGYTCVSEERGYSRVLARYRLLLTGSSPRHSVSPLLPLCLLAALMWTESWRI
ncbi:semaphorin-7A [Dunckerocampus dactyliophorus]|uniref:semaphorin-7A n=1 Tax=Dunckerocampus dactyliophorus TaxID=161453 RepID=UPI002406B621|nr:semaphorin-7A [Dunckerocampus dactyliophorus]